MDSLYQALGEPMAFAFEYVMFCGLKYPKALWHEMFTLFTTQ